MQQGFQPEEGQVVLKCPNCSTENPSDSIFCQICPAWLVRQWESVLIKGKAPITFNARVSPRRSIAIGHRFASVTAAEARVEVLQSETLDIFAYVGDPNRNIVTSNGRERLRRSVQLSWQTYVPGEYKLSLNNSFSTFTSKVIRLTLQGF